MRDVGETLVKLPASILARRLIEHGGADAQLMRRRIAVVTGGGWNDLARDAAARLGRAEPNDPLAPIAALFSDGAPYRLMVDGLAAARNRYLGHSALRANPAETAAIVCWLVARRPGDHRPLDAPDITTLVDGLGAAAGAQPWAGLRLEALGAEGAIELTGAAALTGWHGDARHTTHAAHRGETLPVQLVIPGEAALPLGPLVGARICQECGRRDVFFFDTVYRWRRAAPAQIDFLDYGRGHKSRYGHDEAADLGAELAAVPPEAIPPPGPADAGLDSGEEIRRLDRMRIDLRYRSPHYLRQPLATFLETHERGIYWLQAPAHVGKTTFVHGLVEPDLREPSIAPGLARGDGGGIAAFYCKSEYRAGRTTFLNTLSDRLKVALDLDNRHAFPQLEQVIDADEPRQAFAAWLEAWRRLKPWGDRRLLVVIDGLDESDAPGTDSLLDLLPAADLLPSRTYLLLTSRPPTDPDCRPWVGPAVTPLMSGDDAAIHDVTLRDAGYLALLHDYVRAVLGDAVPPYRVKRLIAQARRRFVFVSFLAEQLRGGQATPAALAALGSGQQIYDRFIEGLDARYGDKRADDLRLVLTCLAAAELAHAWMFGEGRVPDEATGGILEPLPREWPGLEIDILAAATAMDAPVERSGGFGHTAEFVEALILLQGALWVWRGANGSSRSRYRLGLKDLAKRLAELRPDAVARAAARLAGLCLDAVAAIAEAAAEPEARDEHRLRGVFPLLPALVGQSGSATVERRYRSLPVTEIAFAVDTRRVSVATRERVAWYSAIMAALHHTAGPERDENTRRNDLAGPT